MSKLKTLPLGVPVEGLGAPQGHDAPPPPFGAGKVVEAPASTSFVDQLARVPVGLTRFKIRCDNLNYRQTKYVLAKEQADAEAFYVANTPIASELERLKSEGADPISPKLIVTVLPD